MGDRFPARLPVARRAGGRRQRPAEPRGRRGREPGTVRPGAARAAAAQVHVHLRYRGRRARGDRAPRTIPSPPRPQTVMPKPAPRGSPTHITRDRDPRGDGWIAPLWWTDGVG